MCDGSRSEVMSQPGAPANVAEENSKFLVVSP